jgi:hypothetical protein
LGRIAEHSSVTPGGLKPSAGWGVYPGHYIYCGSACQRGDGLTPKSRAHLLNGLNFLDHGAGLLRLLIKALGGAPP